MPAVLVTGPTVTQDSPFSSLAVAVTIASTHFAYPQRDDQAEMAWVAWLNNKTVHPRTVTHLRINPARRRVTSLMCPMTLPLSQTATYTVVQQQHVVAMGLCLFISHINNTEVYRLGNCNWSSATIAIQHHTMFRTGLQFLIC